MPNKMLLYLTKVKYWASFDVASSKRNFWVILSKTY